MMTGRWSCYNCDDSRAEYRDDFGKHLCDICYSTWLWEHEQSETVAED